MDIQKEIRAIEYLKLFEPPGDSYYLCYSGGKDSDVIRILAQLADVRHTIEHNHTTVDTPETVYYVRSIPNVHINYPEKSMWELIVENKMPPTRLVRYCCSKLKERGGKGKLKITGVRKEESARRKQNTDLIKVIGKPKGTEKLAQELGLDYEKPMKNGLIMNMDNADSRRFVEQCYRTRTTMINPILDWSTEDVWEFLHHYGCKGNPLYSEFSRVGCVGCPLANKKQRLLELELYPKYKQNFIRTFDRIIEARKEAGMNIYQNTGEELFEWWLTQ